MNYQAAVNRTFPRCICDKNVSAEVQTEYNLPDYEDEIRRLLRVNVTVIPPASYVGSGSAAFSGTLRFDMLYVSPEGKLCMIKTTEGYELSAPLDRDAEIDYADEIQAFCDLTPESTVSRVLAPRKLSLRCRLRGKVRAYGKSSPTETLSGDFSPIGIERLAATADPAAFASALSEDFELSESIDPPRLGETELIGCEGTVHVLEALCEENAVLCRGEVLVRLLASTDGSSPYAISARIPFSERVEGDGFMGGMSCRAYGEITEMTAEMSDGKMEVTAAFRLSAEGQCNLELPYTRDLYSAEHETECSYAKISYPHAAVCKSGNFTQSLYEPLEGYDIPADAEILDLTARAHAEDILCDRGKWALVGESRMSLLYRTGEEYKVTELSLPFRYELEGECGEVESYAAELHMSGGRARIDGGRLAIDCEMGVTLRLCLTHTAMMLKEANFGARVPACEEYTVCFPKKDDTLWEVAKRYHAPLSRLRARNSLGENDAMGDYLIING